MKRQRGSKVRVVIDGFDHDVTYENLVVTHPDADHGIDFRIVGNDGNLILAQAKAHTEHVPELDLSGSGPVLIERPRRVLTGTQLIWYAHNGPSSAGRNARNQELGFEPPALAQFLLALVPVRHRETMLGDLEEEYWTRLVPKYGFRKARFWYWVQASYEIGGFITRILAGIAGIAWIRKLLEELVHRITN